VATWDSPQVRHRKQTRRDEIMLYICTYAKENNGITPTVRNIARQFGLHLSTIQTHMQKLVDERRLYWIEGAREQRRYRVEESVWNEPPDIEL
jgi:DNA-binding MarR family transcriptional regulator